MRVVIAAIVGLAGISFGAFALNADEAAKWTADIDVLRTEFLEKEKSFTRERREEFLNALAALEKELSNLNDAQTVVRVFQAVAIARNAHTSAVLSGYGLFAPRLPIRVWWFGDELYIVKSRPEPNLAGKRITKIGGHDPKAVLDAVATLFYGNSSWRKFNSLRLMVMPKILYGLGLIDNPERVEVVVDDGAGKSESTVLAAEAPKGVPEREEPWWNLTPAKTFPDTGWVHVLDPIRDRLPLYLKEPNTVFWYEYFPELKVIYVQYNGSQYPKGMSKLDTRRAIETLAQDGAQRLVFDLRMNTGGDYTLMRGLFDWFMDNKEFQQPKSLYVITGRATFSAGLFHAANIKTQGGIVAGELVGDDLDFWAEGDDVVLPNSKIVVHAQDGFHGYSKKQYPEYDALLHTNLDLDTMEPDIPVDLTWDDYVNGRDPVLEAVLAHRPTIER